jgi:hypothetical protein
LLFDWRADYLLRSPLTLAALNSGQTATFVRDTIAYGVDSAGLLHKIANYQWRTQRAGTASPYEAALLLEQARTNLCLRSEDFGTTWAAISTPTRTAAAKTCGDLVLDLIGDDSAGSLEGYSQVITFTGTAAKAIGIHLAAGTSTETVLRLRDTTAGANRLLLAITWSGGVPSVVMTTGSAAGSPVALANGVYYFEFQTTSVTAGNTNQLEVYPATTAALAVANTGTVYAGGVTAYNALFGGSYLKTTSGTVTRNGEALTFPALWPLSSDETWYVRLMNPLWNGLSGTLTDNYVLSRGVTGSRLAIRFEAAARSIDAVVYDGSTTQFRADPIPAPVSGYIDLSVQFKNLRTAAAAAIDTGAGLSAFCTAVTGLGSLTNSIYAGDAAWSTGNQAHVGVTHLKMASGLQTLAYMRTIY